MRLRALSLAFVAVGMCSVTAHAASAKLAVMPTQLDATSQGLVPKLFDDYLLAAVQNAGDFEVIGQEDIAALIGFEKQKEILGCDDAACLADVGNALGVDRLLVVKIACLGEDWVVTSKLINIRATKVEARASEIVSGAVKELLQAVPRIPRQLFAAAQLAPAGASTAHAGDSGPPATLPAASPAAPGRAASASGAFAPNPDLGRGKRIGGIITTFSGVGMATLAVMTSLLSAESCNIGTYDFSTSSYGEEQCSLNGFAVAMQLFMGAGGLAAMGVGSSFQLNGRAEAATGEKRASGHVWYRWLAWALAAGSVALPIAAASKSLGGTSLLQASALTTIGAGVLFTMSGFSSSAHAVSGDRELQIAARPLFIPRGERTTLAGVALALEL